MKRFFTYKLKRRYRGVLRVGKGSVEETSKEALQQYLTTAYPQQDGRWTHAEVTLHTSEAAAFKAGQGSRRV